MYFKKLLKIIGLLLIWNLLVIGFYKMVLAFPSENGTYIEYNLGGKVYEIVTSISILLWCGCALFSMRDADWITKIMSGVILAVINGLMIFGVTLAIFLINNVFEFEFLQSDAIETFFCVGEGLLFYAIGLSILALYNKITQKQKK